MNRRHLTTKMSANSGLTIAQCDDALTAFIDVIKDELPKGKDIKIAKFGRFSTKMRKATRARDIRRKLTIKVPAKIVPIFTAYPELREVVK